MRLRSRSRGVQERGRVPRWRAIVGVGVSEEIVGADNGAYVSGRNGHD
jgi:hypothetical protein